MSAESFPKTWKLHPLEEVMEAIIDYRGKTPTKTELGIPLITAKIVKNGYVQSPTEFIAEENYDTWMVRGLPEVGDVVLTTEAPLGETAQLTSSEVALAQRIVTLRGLKGVLDNDFLLCAMQSKYVQNQLEARATGSTVKGIKQSELRKVLLPIPPLEEQLKIAGTLKSLSDKISLNIKTNQTLEQIAQAIFKSWFVDFDPVKAKIAVLQGGGTAEQAEFAAMSAISAKDETALKQLQAEQPEAYAELAQTAALFPSKMVDSELGEVPEGWNTDSFSKLARLDTTSVKPNNYPDKVWDHFSIPAFDVDQSPAKELGSTIKSGKYKVKKTSVLSSKLNPHFPRTWWPDIDDEVNAICSTEFMQFVPKKDERRAFIYCLITSAPFQEGISQRVTGTTGSRQRAQPPQVAAMNVVTPHNDLMDRFSQRVLPILETKSKNIKQNNSLSALRASLLPKLLSGELPVMEV
ncbi:restriction endonuclease subunit S [Hahella sp. NBU794]|uniref:restriction endonuclease subunit S n=1 Tax=Hahella sp. NBU794 TaxID=3422590 RepID=UPI003D6E4E67